eukprot:TRINITY_DN5202_c0_g1_i3.p1 TRINITY_DN5202_c0_g1~~TRINITY_DN5202_c0_g1_i3.p1  ORF type:complete len:696 (-),score=184.11 TRINITY_DN5202_c0_g1_i3:28-2016(-)
MVAGKETMVEEEEAVKTQKEAITREVKSELLREKVKKQEAELEADHQRKEKEKRFQMLEAQVQQAKDALHKVKQASLNQENYIADVAEVVDKQLQSVNDMSRIRLEMCGLHQGDVSAGPDANVNERAVTLARMGVVSSRASKDTRAGSSSLNCIQEEDDDFPDDSSQLDAQSRFAESEDPDQVSISGSSMENTKVWASGVTDRYTSQENLATAMVLEKELEKERSAKQSLKKENIELKVQQDELQQHMNNLMRKLQWTAQEEYEEAKQQDQLKSELLQEAMQSSKDMLRLNKEIILQEDDMRVDAQEMAERFSVVSEQLRVASMRITDLKQELEREADRHSQEIRDLQAQLDDEIKARDPDSLQTANKLEDYRRLLEEMRKELQTVNDKLHAAEVDHRIQISEIHTTHKAEFLQSEQKYAHATEALRSEVKHEAVDRRQDDERTKQAGQRAASLGLMEDCFGRAFEMLQPILKVGSGQTSQGPPFCLQELLWQLLSDVVNTVVISCDPSTLQIQKVSLKAFELLGQGLPGKLLFSLLAKEQESLFVRRTILNHTVMRTDRAEESGCTWHEVGTFMLNKLRAKMIALHVAAEPAYEKDMAVYVVLLPARSSTGIKNQMSHASRSASRASSDICPNDSVSMIGYETSPTFTPSTGAASKLRTNR